MAALTRDRNTTSAWKGRRVPMKVKANVVIFKGAMVAKDATGFAVPAAVAAGLVVVGIADGSVYNIGGADGAQSIDVDKGTFLLNNNGTGPVVQATVGSLCQVADDNTVQVSGAAGAVNAGVVDFIDPTGQIGVFFG